MKKEAKGQLADSLRPWVSLAITIHFFALIVSLAANLSPSELQRRILKVLTPYTVGLHQNYQGVPLEMTRGTEIDHPCEFEVRRADAEPWETLGPPAHFLSKWDQRWRTLERMTSIIATEQNEPLVQLLFEQCVRQTEQAGGEPIESVRLVRRASLSYAADQTYLAGELPKSEGEDRTLFECRVVRLDEGRIGLIPVLESMRTSKTLQKADETSVKRMTPPDAQSDVQSDVQSDAQSGVQSDAEEDAAALEAQP